MDKIKFSIEDVNNLKVHYLEMNKFKTNIMIINIGYNLEKSLVTKIALLPYLLKRGTENYPSIKKIQEKLDFLYGSILNVNVFKRGERHIVQFSIEFANEKYIRDTNYLIPEVIKIIGDILTNPLNNNGGFNEEFLKIEKEMLRNRIRGILDDKIRYAEYKTIKHMCENEPYRLSEQGEIEDIDEITSENLYHFYEKWLETAPIDLYFIGNFQINDLLKNIKASFEINKRKIKKLQPNTIQTHIKEEKLITEELEVTQGKLNIGLRTYSSIQDDNYAALLMYNGILGSYAHSKLFINVREKASLAYYASSRLDSHKGIITIQSGIESGNFDKTLEIIKRQLELLKNGEISKEELALTKSIFSSQLKEIYDNPRLLVDFDYHSVLSNKERTLDEILRLINDVTNKDVENVAQKIKIDTIYFLKGISKEEY